VTNNKSAIQKIIHKYSATNLNPRTKRHTLDEDLNNTFEDEFSFSSVEERELDQNSSLSKSDSEEDVVQKSLAKNADDELKKLEGRIADLKLLIKVTES